MELTPGFWQGKRVLVTGHTGFKGSWMALWLHALGARVHGFSLEPPSQPSLFGEARVADVMESSTHGDVRDLASVREAVARTNPDIVIHMAAQSLVRPSYAAPVETYATNVMGTVHVLEAVRATKSVRVVVVVTSDKCYENREWDRGYVETDAFGGFDPYSSSKGCAEIVTAAYRRSFFSSDDAPAVASVRAGNVIGGGDWAIDRLVPDIMRAFAARRPAEIRNPAAIRPWQHVLDPLHGYLGLTERLWTDAPSFAGGWNFGAAASDTKPVSWIADRLVRVWGDDSRWTSTAGKRPHEATLLSLDCTKARTELAWMPRLPLEHALRWTADWYRGHAQGADARALTLEQISGYSAIRAT